MTLGDFHFPGWGDEQKEEGEGTTTKSQATTITRAPPPPPTKKLVREEALFFFHECQKNLFLSFLSFLFSNRKERERKTVTWEKEKGSDPWRERRRRLLFLLFFFFGDAASGRKESSAHISSRRRGRRKQEWTEGGSVSKRGEVSYNNTGWMRILRNFSKETFFFVWHDCNVHLRGRLIKWRDGISKFYEAVPMLAAVCAGQLWKGGKGLVGWTGYGGGGARRRRKGEKNWRSAKVAFDK